MRLDLGSVSLSISKNGKNGRRNPSLSDVSAVNDDHISYLKRASEQSLNEVLKGIIARNVNDGVEHARNILNKEGIVIVPDFLSPDVIDECSVVISELKEALVEFLASSVRIKETNKILFQKGKEKLSSYAELSTYPKTVVQVREGQDQGMVDIFNVDFAFPEFLGLRSTYESGFVKEILSAGEESVGFKNLNLYVNSGITKTRGFHVDSYYSQLKAFVYLTDCLSLDDGPYTYVKGSHVESPYRRLNQEISSKLPNKTEAPLLDREKIVPVLGKKGTLVISDQCGFHRGFPQSPGRDRVIAVMNIK